jgi:transcriptional regulator with XRE-family HTH domain
MGEDGNGKGTGVEPEVSDSLRTFGAVVQALREHAGLTRDEFAPLVRYSRHTVASVEQGRRMPDASFVDRAEEALGNTGVLRNAARHLSRQPGLAGWFRKWAALEAEAISLYTYECLFGPAAADASSPMSIDDLAWFKSSYSSSGDGDCIEVALRRSAVRRTGRRLRRHRRSGGRPPHRPRPRPARLRAPLPMPRLIRVRRRARAP